MQPLIFLLQFIPILCILYAEEKMGHRFRGMISANIVPYFYCPKYITLTLCLYSCIMYIQAKPIRFYRARVFGQAPKFLPKIQALCLCRAPFASLHFAKVGKIEKVFDRTAKVIYDLFINIAIYPLAVSRSNYPELADTKGFLFA